MKFFSFRTDTFALKLLMLRYLETYKMEVMQLRGSTSVGVAYARHQGNSSDRM